MNAWANDIFSPPVAARADGDPSRATPFCDDYCILFYDTRLHSIECQRANRMDPVFPDRKIDDVLPSHMELEDAVRGTPYEEGNE